MLQTVKENTVYKELLLFYLLFFLCQTGFAQFTPGNLVVLQAGDGSTALINTGNKIVLREFNPLGLATFSIAIPTSTSPLLIGGSASSEGGLSLSANGEYLVFAGYAQSLPNATPLSGSSASAINRGVGIVDAAGGYTRIATSTTFFTGNNIRSAASDGNNNFWAAGSNNGTDYFGLNSPALTVQNAVTNTRCISVLSNSLFVSCGSGTFGICRVGSVLPFATGQGASLVINTSTTGSGSASPYGFCFHPSLTVCYVADDRNPANGGGIQKWVNNAGTWSLAYTLGTGANYGARGLTVDFSGPAPRVYATTSEGSSNRLIAINDLGAASAATLLATAASNSAFRGLAFSPNCSNPLIAGISSNSPACAGQALALTTSVSGPGPFTYSWSGPGGFSSSLQNPVVSNPLSGAYTFSMSNACGSDTTSLFIQVYPLPPLAVNQPIICNGGTAVLIAGGASSYTWNTGNTSSIYTVTPTGSTIFTLSGTSAPGCIHSVTTAVQVVNALTLSATSATLCAGGSATVSASGAATYSWSSGVNSPTASVSPSLTTVYSVTGTASGCLSPGTTTALVMVNALPSVSLSLSRSPVCLNDTVVTVSGFPAGGSYTGPGLSGNLFDPAISGAGVYTLSYTYVDNAGCSNSDEATLTVDICTSVEKQKYGLQLSLYADPASGKLLLTTENVIGMYSAEVYSMNGSLLFSGNLPAGEGSIEIGHYQPGIYILKWSAGSNTSALRFVKE